MICVHILLSVIFVVIQKCVAPRVCTISAGCYNGTFMISKPSTDLFEAFLGMPYSQKVKRFEPPVLYKSSKEHNATKSGRDCLQKNYLGPDHVINGGEDCLYLNVYRKSTKSDYLLPVMVYIFGGGFFSGTSSPIFVGPEYIMDANIREDVILVSFNYRLGALGFMATSDGVIPGNLGLKDQLCALEWVNENIIYFRGNRNKVTLFGQSAGAVSAHMHMLSPISRNFHAVIAMSGTANVPFAIDDDPDYTARQTARYCNIKNWDTINTTVLREEFLKVDQMDLINAGDHLKYWDVDNLVNYRPIVEPATPKAFFAIHPTEILRSGIYRYVPTMYGRVTNEGGVRVVAIMESDKLRTEFNNDFHNLMIKFLEFPKKFNTSQINEKMKEIIDEYFQGNSVLNDDTRQGFMDLVTDRGFYHPFYNALKFNVRTINTKKFPIYMYKFDFEGLYTYADLYAGGKTKVDYGVVHCDDLLYLFRSPIIFPDYPRNATDNEVVNKFIRDFVHYAHFMQPVNAEQIEECNKTTFSQNPNEICAYKEFYNDDRDFLKIDIIKTFNTKRMAFWDRILEENND